MATNSAQIIRAVWRRNAFGHSVLLVDGNAVGFVMASTDRTWERFASVPEGAGSTQWHDTEQAARVRLETLARESLNA